MSVALPMFHLYFRPDKRQLEERRAAKHNSSSLLRVLHHAVSKKPTKPQGSTVHFVRMDEDDSELVSYSQVLKCVGGFTDSLQTPACEERRARQRH